ncbi:MAG: DUF1028 domain-containing protein [Planctomycetota bacterium]
MKISMLARRAACLVAASTLLVSQALATWSIVVIDRSTGEVCVASATCLGNQFPLQRWLPVIVVGRGAAAAQSAIDNSAQNRMRIWNLMHAGATPKRILEQLALHDGGHQSRQYGITSFDGPPVTFTGTGAGVAKLGVTGVVGSMEYAIQGNVLAGDPVIFEAEKALVNTQGDLGQKVMAAMQAARFMGGDGRCSCNPADPPSCGSPPPNFTKSAHTVFIVLARMGDTDGVCDLTDGCANGNYYLLKFFNGKASGPDPMVVLRNKYANWRANLGGIPDAIHSEVHIDRQQLVADGLSTARVVVVLRDVEGRALVSGGDTLTVVPTTPGAPTAIPGPVTDHGDGTYSFDMLSTTTVGRGAWNLVVKYKPKKSAQLYPPMILATTAVVDLHSGFYEYSIDTGTPIPFTLNRGMAESGRAYHLLGSFSGTSPGIDLGGLNLPLNRDRFFEYTWFSPGPPGLTGFQGMLDADGRALAWLDMPTESWAVFVGERFDFCALLGGAIPEITQLVGFEVLP